MTIHLFFSLFLFPSCQGELSELRRAKEQYAKGAKLEALQMYEDIITRYPDHPSAKEAKVLLENMYFEAAKIAAPKNPLSAYRIAQRQIQMFPSGGKSKEVQSFLEDIRPKALAFQESQKEAEELCEQAKLSKDVLLWRKYIQEYPTGNCTRLAQDEIRDLDKKRCAEAREGNPTLWHSYLNDFPQGTCISEAQENSVRKEITKEGRSVLDTHVKECARLAEKCPRLHERYGELIRKNETDYLRGSYYAYLNNWLSAYGDAAKLGEAELQRLDNEGFEISTFTERYNNLCVQACAQNNSDLSDLRSCVLAFDAKSADKWNEYTKNFPSGACVSIALP